MNWNVKFEKFISTMENEYFRELLLEGLVNTINVAVLGLLIGILIGSVIAVVKVAPKYKFIIRILDKICTMYVAIFRGTPIVVQLSLAYYVLLPTMGVRDVDSLTVGIIKTQKTLGGFGKRNGRIRINSFSKCNTGAKRSFLMKAGR